MTPDEFVQVPKTGRVFQLKLPMRIQSSKKKKTAINLNVYRNLHFRSLTAQKHNFAKIVEKLLQGVPKMGTIGLHYAVSPQTRRRLDVGNVASIVDKYFSDCLTENGIIEDDNYHFIPFVSSGFGGLCSDEHVLVTITEIEPRKENPDMRILLDQADIQTALEAFVETQGIAGASGVHLSVNGEEITAEVLMGGTSAKKAPAKRNKGGRPAGSKNKPKEETADVETPVQDSPDVGSGGDTATTKAETEVPVTTDDVPVENAAKAKAAKNLFGDEESPSSKDSPPEAEVVAEDAPKAVKKNSIFDQ